MTDKTVKNQLLIGLDPEYFLSKNGKLVSAYGVVGGTKEQPIKVKHGAYQCDGMAVEFNIDPAKTEGEFLRNINSVMGILKELFPEYEHQYIPVAEFGLDYIRAQPEKAKELGCSPDFDAWKVAINPRPNGELPFRSAAGHVHFGFIESADAPVEDQDFIEYCAQRVRELDFYLALPSLFYDADTKRRELYGKAGAFRPKKYGFEYRTLSNGWLKSDALKSWVYQASLTAWNKMEAGVSLMDKYGDIQHIINTSDKKEAKRIITAENILMPMGV